ncbi:MAG: hypothetical protein HY534_07000 [Chloroflexi bacterium]|nr:hypothetical protein [Chloroflexota bacterium]
MNLTITDGFKLGCGLLLAGASAIVFVLLAISVSLFVLTLAGIRLPLAGFSGS